MSSKVLLAITRPVSLGFHVLLTRVDMCDLKLKFFATDIINFNIATLVTEFECRACTLVRALATSNH
jgi:hypothetical protein